MTFGWINVFGAGIVVLMLIPNIIYAVKNKDEKNLCSNKILNIAEQIGRYGCMVLMCFPVLVWEFGFKSVLEMLIYTIGNGLLLLAYWVVYFFYFKEKTANRAIALAVLPSCIFLLSGITLRHWLLIAFAAVFAVSHILITKINTTKKSIRY